MNVIAQIKDRIDKAKRIAISSHIRPDADCIGSGLALYHMLKQFGKDVSYINTDVIPFPLTNLPGYDVIEYGQIFPKEFDLCFLIEGGTENRTGQKHLDNYSTINIDHHATSVNDSNLNWVEPNAAAVGVLIYELAVELGVNITKTIGFNLYAAISSDTGSFKYSNTTERSLRIASEIIKKSKIAPEEVSDLLYNSNSYLKIMILQKVLATLQLFLDKQVSIIELKREFLGSMKLMDVDTEDIVAIARSIQSLKVTLFFKEIDDNYYRVSIRAKGDFNSQNIAGFFGGGGHKHAAGFFYRGNIENAKKDILDIIKKELNK
jgi:phosphoesterase RecJ-like protein